MLSTGGRSSTKFRDELRKYPWPPSSAIKAHGKRWLDDDRSEEVWQKVSKAAGAQLRPDDFIRFVITARGRAAGLVPTLDFYAEAGRRYLAAHEARIKDALKSNRSLSEIADVLEEAASDFRLCDNLLDQRLSELPPNAVSRKDQKGSQARRAFCWILFDFFKERCRMWMEEEVATLLEIALPRKKPATVDEVHEFRKVRRSKST
jgi:hypothetical protein